MLDWATSLGLVCLNDGRASTCIRPNGESIVDLTWASPLAADRVGNWKVLTNVESLSDHAYIEMTFRKPVHSGPEYPKKWPKIIVTFEIKIEFFHDVHYWKHLLSKFHTYQITL